MTAEPLPPEPEGDDPYELPVDREAERYCLAAMLRWGQAIEAVTEIAVPDDFSVHAHQLLAEAMIVMWAQQLPVDPVTLRAYMEREHPRTALWGGPGYLIELDHVASKLVPQAAEHHARLVRDAAVRRTFIESGLRLAQRARDRSYDTADLIRDVEGDVARAVALTAAQPSSPVDQLMTLSAFCDVTLARAAPVIPGLLDMEDRAVIVAHEGAGKSTVLQQLAIAPAAGVHPFTWAPIPPVRTLMIDLENPRGLLQRRSRKLLAAAELSPGWDPSRVTIWSRPGGLDLNDPRNAYLLRSVIRKAEPQLVVAGPIYKMLREVPGVSAAVTHGGVAWFWEQVRDEHGAALVLETHPPIGKGQGTKRGTRDLRPQGWAGWTQWPEFGLALEIGKGGSLRFDRFRGDREEGRMWPDRLDRNPSWSMIPSWPWSAVYPTGTFMDQLGEDEGR